MADNGVPLILLTRPRLQSERFAARIEGASRIEIAPLQDIVATGPLPPLDGIRGLIFTSENGVRTFAEMSPRRDLPAWCVGARTAEVAAEAGMSTLVAGGSADALVQAMTEAAPDGPFLHLHGHHTRGDVVARLKARGLGVQAAEIYDQRAVTPPPPIARMAQGRTVLAPLFSPRSAALFGLAIGSAGGRWRLICLSAAVCAELPDALQGEAEIAEEPTAEAMLRLIRKNISL